MNEALMPVLVGCGQYTDKRDPEEANTPVQTMAEVSRRAAADTGVGEALLQAVETLVSVGLVVDSGEGGSIAGGTYRNVPATVAGLLGISPRDYCYTQAGGNTPQMLVNRYCEAIAQGRTTTVLLTGAEALGAMVGRLKRGLSLDEWQDDPGGEPEMIGSTRRSVNDCEALYGIQTPANTYPLFENALRGKYQLSLEQHQQKLGELYAGFNAVAAENPLSWFPTRRSAEEIATPSENNRYVGFPYTKYLNSVIQVNQGAAVILTSVAKAREMGIAEEKWVYLHGCGDANDIWNVTDRENYYSSPAIRTIGQWAFSMAGKSVADMSYFDIYSCFPSAVQIACDELGIAHDDPRGLTVTGGLPYFGGPGNNYVMHSIASMMEKLRADPGSFGLLNANGWFVTKHALGIYSTTPPQGDWQREDPASYQQAIDEQAHPEVIELAEGAARVETYTIVHGRGGAERCLVIGRLGEAGDGARFLAETPADPTLLEQLKQVDMLGMSGAVSNDGEKNLFLPKLGD